MAELAESEALLAELNERIREATIAQDDKLTQDGIDAFDKALCEALPSGNLYGRGVQCLRRWCRTSGQLPSSYTLAATVELESNRALFSTALSNVYVGHYRGTKVTVKEPRLHLDEVDSVQKAFRNEIVTWKYLRHPNIVPFYGTSDLFPICTVSGWMPGGTISAFLREHPEENRSKYIEQIVLGLRFMHNLGVIHGDLKAANILVDQHGHARLLDFGIATVLSNSSTLATTEDGLKGTIRYMAPELFAVSEAGSDCSKPTASSDVYSLAITIWQLFSGHSPFPNIRVDHIIPSQVLAGGRPLKPTATSEVGFTDDVWDIMQRGWAGEPSDRPTLSEFLKAIGPDHRHIQELRATGSVTSTRSENTSKVRQSRPTKWTPTFGRRRPSTSHLIMGLGARQGLDGLG